MTDAALQARLRRRRGAAQAGRHEPGGGARRRPADRASCSPSSARRASSSRACASPTTRPWTWSRWCSAGQVQQGHRRASSTRPAARRSGLTGQDGGLIRAQQAAAAVDKDDRARSIDVGQVGEIESIDPAVIKALRGRAASSRWWRRSASAPTARPTTSTPTSSPASSPRCCEAEKLMVLTNTPGVLDKDGKLLTGLTPRKIDELFAEGHDLRRHAAEDRLGARRRAKTA